MGEIPGENAVDTKINPDSISTGYRPMITIRNAEAHGFEPGYISINKNDCIGLICIRLPTFYFCLVPWFLFL
ncbi:MAG: hypothetical protein GWN16_05295 [Calditrichae bacterium]|nr:hypothetical protein [Calditrichia bacterium]